MAKLNKESILSELHNKKDHIKKFGVKKLILFGSYARGEETKDSDIDFLVEFDKNRGLVDDYLGILHLLEDNFNKKIDLVKPSLIREELKPYIIEGKKYEAKI